MLHVNQVMFRMQCVRSYFRNFSSKSNYVLEYLKNRSLLRLSGTDAALLLQGLITNDMQHLSHGAGSMFAMFLNNKGRVLYDTIIYRPSLENIYFVEIDKQACGTVKKHLNFYCLRKKVDISEVDDELKVWVHYNPTVSSAKESFESNVAGHIVPCDSLEKSDKNVATKTLDKQEILIFRDPRLLALGSRIIAPAVCDNNKIIELFLGTSGLSYKQFRYNIGVGEGVEELPPGNCFPLEANCDYLHGVSFHKGCYVGQELTARTHHTGIVRKRLMPLKLEASFTKQPLKDEIIKAEDTNVGKLRGFEQDSALGLLRITQALKADKLVVNNTNAKTNKPIWWPQEASKEKISSSKL